uniref:Uncharacterized protein n=1 Tax=Plectus sambesii TaxID=2011161 RepID=A0A914UQK9_9BILA
MEQFWTLTTVSQVLVVSSFVILYMIMTRHKCCSRKVEQMMKDMQKMVNEMDEHANETSIKREMLDFIKEESEKRFCDSGSGQAFDVMIANGEFATEANVPKSEPNACKMEISLGGRRLKRAVNGVVQPVVKLVVLTKQIVSGANDANSKPLSFQAGKEGTGSSSGS